MRKNKLSQFYRRNIRTEKGGVRNSFLTDMGTGNDPSCLWDFTLLKFLEDPHSIWVCFQGVLGRQGLQNLHREEGRNLTPDWKQAAPPKSYSPKCTQGWGGSSTQT